ncbi:acyl carrier protein [Niveibacterium sp. SC-1]|uniref:acyl carrier protein n=1 Tax=Niveibacterium sp. SC-1 TaxID=3135646 RepID=UPI00312027AE
MKREEIYTWLVKVLEESFEIDAARVTPEANLYTDLDIDSIDAVDLMLRAKELTGRRIQPEVFKSVRTVQDVVNALYDVMAESA